MPRLILPLSILGLITFAVATPPSDRPRGLAHGLKNGNDGAQDRALRGEADLSGEQEVPPNDSDAEGEFTIKFDCEFTRARFRLEVHADDVLQAHLHCGSAGENGPVVAFLFGLFPGGVDVDGQLSALTLTQANLDAVNVNCAEAVGYQIETLEDLADAMAAGDVYVNVHTVAFPGGEIRGQVEVEESRVQCENGNNDDNEDDENENENDNDNGDGHDHGDR